MEKRYELDEQTLYLIDKDLGLSISEPFLLPKIPKDLNTEFVDNCQLKVIRDFSDNPKEIFFEKEGLLHGEKRLFYDQKRLCAKMFYKEGKLHGPSVFYSKEGVILSKSFFYEGVKQGLVIQNYLSGKLYCIQSFKDGVRQKKQIYYFENQKIKTLLNYENGFIEGEVTLYWSFGKIRRRCFFIQGKKDGIEEIYNEKGILLFFGEYKNNAPVGVHKRWDDKGKLISQVVY